VHIYKILILALLTYIVSCSTLKPSSDQVQSQVPPDQDTASKPVPNETPISDVDFGAVIFSPVDGYATAQEKAMIKKAGELVNNTLHSQCFRDYMASRRLIQTKNLSNKEVIEQISRLSGLVAVSMYFNRWSSAMAYRQPPELKINLNRKYFSASGKACEWASTMAHETMHALLNFEHSFKWTPEREFSVPYSTGMAVDSCCK
jgi:hypothetical protein